jgi:anti-sigma regulatory factor (Ser/Thr protein kinase)
VRIVGEPIWTDRTTSEYPACAKHEALINAAFERRHVTIVCPYDVTQLEPHVVSDAEATHPLVWESSRRWHSRRYAPDAVIDRYDQPLDSPERAAVDTVTVGADLVRVRLFTVEHARREGLAPERIRELGLIVTELVSNSLLHVGRPGVVGIWSDEEHLIGEVSDSDRLTDRLAGRRPAVPGQPGGLGLLLVNELADLVRTHTHEAGHHHPRVPAAAPALARSVDGHRHRHRHRIPGGRAIGRVERLFGHHAKRRAVPTSRDVDVVRR